MEKNKSEIITNINLLKDEDVKFKIDIDLWNLVGKERWNHDDVVEFGRLRKLKYGDNRAENTSGIFYQIWKQHTKPTSKLVRSWKECVMKFYYEGFEPLSIESNKKFEGIEVPFYLYHKDIVDCDIVKIIGIRGVYKRFNHVYYLCSGENQGMRLITKEALDSFKNLDFEDRGSIDFVEKNGKYIDSNGERKAFQIIQNNN